VRTGQGETNDVDAGVRQRGAIEATVLPHVTRWRDLLTESVDDGRALLRDVLAEPLVFTPEGADYRFRAPRGDGRATRHGARETPRLRTAEAVLCRADPNPGGDAIRPDTRPGPLVRRRPRHRPRIASHALSRSRSA